MQLNIGNKCIICPHECILGINERGKCLVRVGIENGIELREYGKMINMAIEPIEKKPLFHYYPNSKVLSVGSFGCNNFCDYCANWKVSQVDRSNDTKYFSPLDLVLKALEKKCIGICLTYNEPTVAPEYIYDLREITLVHNLKLIIKTNAFVNKDSWRLICGLIDAANIDFKGNPERHKNVTGVNDFVIIERIRKALEYMSCHIEISIPVYSDSNVREYYDFCNFIRDLDVSVPIHLLKVVPANKFIEMESTSNKLMEEVYDYFKQYMKYVYIHNVYNSQLGRDTICYECGKNLIKRNGFKIEVLEKCGCENNIIW